MNNKRIIAAQKAYEILIDHAKKKETITYALIGEMVGYGSRSMGGVLSLIQNHCIYESLPPLTRLVVNFVTELPGYNYQIINSYEEDLKNVIEMDWYLLAEQKKYKFKEKYL